MNFNGPVCKRNSTYFGRSLYSLLLGETNWKRTDFESTDNRSCQEIMRSKLYSCLPDLIIYGL